MGTPAASDRKGLQEPIRQFCGSHDDILGGLQELRVLPELAALLRRARAGAAATLDLFDHLVLRRDPSHMAALDVSLHLRRAPAPSAYI